VFCVKYLNRHGEEFFLARDFQYGAWLSREDIKENPKLLFLCQYVWQAGQKVVELYKEDETFLLSEMGGEITGDLARLLEIIEEVKQPDCEDWEGGRVVIEIWEANPSLFHRLRQAFARWRTGNRLGIH
jgi:hypothetical protein